tara:strand:- start:540 stop:881 length:342 start_codon:yes stop_codon:yes gene_type:complete
MEHEFLLMDTRGEQDLMKFCPFLTELKIDTFDNYQWCTATTEYNLNPFGLLIKSPATFTKKGKVVEHVKYYHGFFATIQCTDNFYTKYKPNLDKYIVTDDHIKIIRDSVPKWL